MRRSLLFLSLIMCVTGVFARDADTEADSLSTDRCAVSIEMKKGHLSGILITRNTEEQIVGTLVNEFGITALSFIYEKDSRKIKLTDVVGFLDKWYIRRVLKGDLKYCLHVLYAVPAKESKNYIVEQIPGSVTVTNKKRGISYVFSPLTTEIDNAEE